MSARVMMSIFSVIVFAMAGTTFAAHKSIKSGDIILASRCQSNPEECRCDNGLRPNTFLANNGHKYFQCVISECPSGTIINETRTRGGRPEFKCAAPVGPPYVEPAERTKGRG